MCEVSKACASILRISFNEEFRSSFLDCLQVTNSTDAEAKLRKHLKDIREGLHFPHGALPGHKTPQENVKNSNLENPSGNRQIANQIESSQGNFDESLVGNHGTVDCRDVEVNNLSATNFPILEGTSQTLVSQSLLQMEASKEDEFGFWSIEDRTDNQVFIKKEVLKSALSTTSTQQYNPSQMQRKEELNYTREASDNNQHLSHSLASQGNSQSLLCQSMPLGDRDEFEFWTQTDNTAMNPISLAIGLKLESTDKAATIMLLERQNSVLLQVDQSYINELDEFEFWKVSDNAETSSKDLENRPGKED